MIYTVAFGDIHGCFDQFEELLNKISAYIVDNIQDKNQHFKFIFLGDYIDRGADSRKVVQRIIDLSKTEEVICLLGNHEAMMIEDMSGWYNNGGYATEESYGCHPMKSEHADFYKSLKLFHDDGKRFFCHAGVTHEPLECNSKMDLIWVREPFLSNKKKWSRLIVHGHTPNFDIQIKPNRINLDSACVFGGKLTCAIFDDTKVEPIEYLWVDGLKKRNGPI